MKNFMIFVCVLLIGMSVTGCQREVTVVPQQPQQQQPNVIVNPQQPNVIVVPGRPSCPPPRPGGIHIDINPRPGYRWCNRCGVWVSVHSAHHCR